MNPRSPIALHDVLGQSIAVGTLRRAMETGRLHHAILFDGPSGVGKNLTAEAVAQCVLCEKPSGGVACGQCAACIKVLRRDAIGRSVHPDFATVAKAMYDPAVIGRKTQETQDISADQVRTVVLARMSLGAVFGRGRLFLIRDADELSVSAANALLKTLEEPPPRTYFILTSTRGGELLPTIRSRVQRIRFGPLPEDALCTILVREGHDPKVAEGVARDAQGSLTIAREKLANGAKDGLEPWISSIEMALEDKTFAGALKAAEGSKGARDTVGAGLEAFAAHLVDTARKAASESSPKALRAADGYVRVQRALRQLDGNASPQLVTEALLADLRGMP